jgi:hypothetical protein
MTLIVEDGTGMATAESYISVDFFKAYHKDRGNSVSLGGSEIEQKLRVATEYIDIRFTPRGLAIAETQALHHPTDYSITDPVSLPVQLQRACAEYAFYAIDNLLFITQSFSDGPGIKSLSEKVGPIETTTEWSGSGSGSQSRQSPSVPKADKLMRMISLGGTGGVYR